MASVASQLTGVVTAHAQSDSLEDAQEICADGTYFPNNLRVLMLKSLSEYGYLLAGTLSGLIIVNLLFYVVLMVRIDT